MFGELAGGARSGQRTQHSGPRLPHERPERLPAIPRLVPQRGIEGSSESQNRQPALHLRTNQHTRPVGKEHRRTQQKPAPIKPDITIRTTGHFQHRRTPHNLGMQSSQKPLDTTGHRDPPTRITFILKTSENALPVGSESHLPQFQQDGRRSPPRQPNGPQDGVVRDLIDHTEQLLDRPALALAPLQQGSQHGPLAQLINHQPSPSRRRPHSNPPQGPKSKEGLSNRPEPRPQPNASQITDRKMNPLHSLPRSTTI